MNTLELSSTKQTPGVNFDPEKGILEIWGRSIPENSFEFYNPLLVWLDEYTAEPKEKTVMQIKLEYFNTSSSKYILEVLKKLNIIEEKETEVLVEWYYDEDDEEMMETGEDYEDVTGLTFKLIEMEEE